MRAGIEPEFLVNNDGFGTNGAFAELDLARELDLIELNITALTHLTGLFVPAMVTRRSGCILNVGSTAGFLPGPDGDRVRTRGRQREHGTVQRSYRGRSRCRAVRLPLDARG